MMVDRDNLLITIALTKQGHTSILQLLETAKGRRQGGMIRSTPRLVKRQAKTQVCLSCVQLPGDARTWLESYFLRFSLRYSVLWLFSGAYFYQGTQELSANINLHTGNCTLNSEIIVWLTSLLLDI